MKFRIFFAWFDFWIGAYWDAGHRTLYICLIPTVVMRFEIDGVKDPRKHRTDRAAEWVAVGSKWPQPYRVVLVATDRFEASAPAINVGYMKYAARRFRLPFLCLPRRTLEDEAAPLEWFPIFLIDGVFVL